MKTKQDAKKKGHYKSPTERCAQCKTMRSLTQFDSIEGVRSDICKACSKPTITARREMLTLKLPNGEYVLCEIVMRHAGPDTMQAMRDFYQGKGFDVVNVQPCE